MTFATKNKPKSAPRNKGPPRVKAHVNHTLSKEQRVKGGEAHSPRHGGYAEETHGKISAVEEG